MTILKGLIIWLDGRKMILAGCIAVVIGYLASIGAIDAKLSAAILAILNILFGGMKIVSDMAVTKNTDFGMSIKSKRIK